MSRIAFPQRHHRRRARHASRSRMGGARHGGGPRRARERHRTGRPRVRTLGGHPRPGRRDRRTRPPPPRDRAPPAGSQGIRSILVVPSSSGGSGGVTSAPTTPARSASGASRDRRAPRSGGHDRARRSSGGTPRSSCARRRSGSARSWSAPRRSPIRRSRSEGPTAASSVLYVSPQVERILGYPAESAGRCPGFWTQIVHPDDLERVLADGERVTGSPEIPVRRLPDAGGRRAGRVVPRRVRAAGRRDRNPGSGTA